MEFYVYSRHALEAARPHEVPHVIVSITSAVDDVARLRINGNTRGVLRLSFPDAEESSASFAEDVLFSAGQARQIWDFVAARRAGIERIVIHCDAGISRSPAVAAALARSFGGDEREFFEGKYDPNMRVYRLLVAAAPDARE